MPESLEQVIDKLLRCSAMEMVVDSGDVTAGLSFAAMAKLLEN